MSVIYTVSHSYAVVSEVVSPPNIPSAKSADIKVFGRYCQVRDWIREIREN